MPASESRWRFTLSVMLPVVLALLITVGLVAGFGYWLGSKADNRSLERQQAVAARVFDAAKASFARSQADQVLRYEVADIFVSGKPDVLDIDDSFGIDEYDTYQHDVVAVLNSDLRPIYVARAGKQSPIKSYDALTAAVDPLAISFRAPAMQSAISAYQNGEADRPPQVVDIVQAGGRAALVSIMPIVSNWEGQEQTTFFYHVALRYLDGSLADQLMADYMIDGLHFDAVPQTLPEETTIPLANINGRFVAYLKWVPDIPGRALLKDVAPALGGLLAVITVVVGLLLRRLANSTRALERARAEALHRATHDPLTGLANRALFTETLERSPLPLTLLALDLDRFKAVNDSLGHEAGDDLLKQVAARLGELVKQQGLVARLGGDEFMILVSGPNPADVIQSLAAQIVEAISKPFRIGREIVQIGISVGIARADTDERRDLVARADFALYDAKESGRNTYRMFEDVAQAA